MFGFIIFMEYLSFFLARIARKDRTKRSEGGLAVRAGLRANCAPKPQKNFKSLLVFDFFAETLIE